MATAAVPVFLKDTTYVPPDLPTYYVLAGNGLHLVRRTPLFSACVPAPGGVPGLLPEVPTVELRIPRLPRAALERAIGFFRAVYSRWGGEAILVLFYAPAARRFALAAPPQVLSGRFQHGHFRAELHLAYGHCDPPGPAYLKLGTLHSHGHAAATCSGTDEEDERYETGLHVTVGHVLASRPAFDAAFVVGRTRFRVPLDRILPPFHASRRFPPSWLARVVVSNGHAHL